MNTLPLLIWGEGFDPEALIRAAQSEAGHAGEILARRKPSRMERVHSARKALKRVRTALRLLDGLISREEFAAAEAAARLASRLIASIRDNDVLTRTLKDLAYRKTSAASLSIDPLLAQASRRNSSLSEEQACLERARRVLVFLHDLFESTKVLEGDALPAAEGNLKSIYRRGRRLARREQLSPDELHELRKRVKDLRHCLELFPQVTCGEELLKKHTRLGDILGEHQDLMVLEAYLRKGSESGHAASEDSVAELLKLARSRRRALVKKSLPLARELYSTKPKAFILALRQP